MKTYTSRTGAVIDVHTYPEHASPEELADYRIAVMAAARDGDPVESRYTGSLNRISVPWESNRDPLWDWMHNEHRIARPKLAAGHNPRGLTEDQVETSKGWRLLERDEIAFDLYGESVVWDHPSVQFRQGDEWASSACGAIWCHAGGRYTYRTRKPVGFFLPKPKLAEGHNPDQLTEDQVETSKGWRLLSPDENSALRPSGDFRCDLHLWRRVSESWKPRAMGGAENTYRTRRPKDFFLPWPNIPKDSDPDTLPQETEAATAQNETEEQAIARIRAKVTMRSVFTPTDALREAIEWGRRHGGLPRAGGGPARRVFGGGDTPRGGADGGGQVPCRSPAHFP